MIGSVLLSYNLNKTSFCRNCYPDIIFSDKNNYYEQLINKYLDTQFINKYKQRDFFFKTANV